MFAPYTARRLPLLAVFGAAATTRPTAAIHRGRYDADQMVAAFAARLKDSVDLDSVRSDLAGVVHQTLEPAHVSVWISERG